MVDGFHGLRHHAVVRGHHQNGNIRGIGSPHTHGGKGLMSRRIQEGNGLIVNSYSIRTDMLCNTSGLFIRYIGLTDGVQKRSFTVVNVSHDADDRRPALKLAFLFLVLF